MYRAVRTLPVQANIRTYNVTLKVVFQNFEARKVSRLFLYVFRRSFFFCFAEGSGAATVELDVCFLLSAVFNTIVQRIELYSYSISNKAQKTVTVSTTARSYIRELVPMRL